MHLIEAKFKMRLPEDMLVRSRVMEQMNECFKKHSVMVMYGAGGAGKTVAAFQYAQQYYSGASYYLKLDVDDNRQERFYRYMRAWMVRAGVLPDEGAAEKVEMAAEMDDGQMTTLMEQIICGLQSVGRGKLFILDDIHELSHPALCDVLTRLIRYIPDGCRFILISRGRVGDSLYDCLLRSEFCVLPLSQMQMNTEEVRELFGVQRISSCQAGEIIRQTEGWCGAVHAVYLYFRDVTHPEEIHAWDNPYLTKFITIHFWNTMSEKIREIYRRGWIFPYITENFCRDVMGIGVERGILEGLRSLGFLHYDVRRKSYRIPEVLKRYITGLYAGLDGGEQPSEKQREERKNASRVGTEMVLSIGEEKHLPIDLRDMELAAAWYVQFGDIIAALNMLCEWGDSELLRTYLLKYGIEAIPLLSVEQLQKMVSRVGWCLDEPVILYLWGMSFLWQGEREKYRDLLQRVMSALRAAQANRHLWGEIYLNLLYEDPECSILEWLDIGVKLTYKIGTIRLYSAAAGNPGICFGAKELSEMFIHDRRMNQANAVKWDRILGTPGQRLLKIARDEFMLEADGERRIIQEINEELMQMGGSNHSVDELLGYAGIILKLTRNGHHHGEYQDVFQEIRERLYRQGCVQAMVNLTAACTVSAGENGDKNELMRWLKNGILPYYELINRESAYVNMMRARGLLMMMQFEQAQTIFEKTAVYYESSKMTLMQARCLFGQAVALYELGDRSKAIKVSARAITLGTKYRYTSVYTEYGKVGVALIEEYQKMVGTSQDNLYTRKKKYYYGNVLTASYEGYHSILLRKARKEVRYLGNLAEQDQVRTVLTMTEMLILQYISQGYSNKQIGELMNIQLTTVKTHVYSIYKKLDVSSRVMAVNKARELKIL